MLLFTGLVLFRGLLCTGFTVLPKVPPQNRHDHYIWRIGNSLLGWPPSYIGYQCTPMQHHFLLEIIMFAGFYIILNGETTFLFNFQLLPLPNSYPVSPDDGENADLLRPASQVWVILFLCFCLFVCYKPQRVLRMYCYPCQISVSFCLSFFVIRFLTN
jgi:hypothetical protein